jgi:hypothetical protein
MSERFIGYGIFILIFYIALFMWNQSQIIEVLREDLRFHQDVAKKQGSLIITQKEYIKALEEVYKQSSSPFYHQPPKNNYKQPI